VSGPIWYIYPPAGGPGIGRYWRAYSLSRNWIAAGEEALVIAPGFHHHFEQRVSRRGLEDVGGVPYYFIRTAPYGQRSIERLRPILGFGMDLVLNRGLANLGHRNPPRAIIYSSPYPFGILGAAALARRYKAKLIFEVRDIWPLSVTELMGVSSIHPFVLAAAWCERFGYRVADRVVGLFDRAHVHMVERGMSIEKFVHIPNGVDLGEYAKLPSDSDGPLLRRARELVSGGKMLVVHPGAMAITTNLEPLLLAARRLQTEGSTDVHILLIGQGETEEYLKARAKALGLENVEFHPQVDKTEVRTLLAEAHLGYVALRNEPIYRFGFSLNKMLDYMSAGLPFLFAYDEAADMVAESGAGIATPSEDVDAIADALVRFAQMPDAERRAMGQSGLAYATARLDYRSLSQSYLEVLD
jgi:glycosyltransferase involved in cell wall biosynthesis